MKSTLLVALALAVTAPLTATAQFIPTLGSDTPRICPEQPPRPDWIENINFRDADKAILVQEMYRAQSMQAVADTGDCSCETRYPPLGRRRSLLFRELRTPGGTLAAYGKNF